MKKLIYVIFLIVMCCAASSAQDTRVTEKLPDGDYIVIIEGIEYRAITAAHARRIAEERLELDKLKRERDLLTQLNDQLIDQVSLLTKDRDLANAMIAFEREQGIRYKLLYEGEHSLRLASEKLARPGAVTRFFDHPVTQVTMKIGWQGVLTWLTARRSN